MARTKEEAHLYYLANKERILARNKAWRLLNPERMAFLARGFRKRHPGRAAADNKRWREQNPAAARASQRRTDAKPERKAAKKLRDSRRDNRERSRLYREQNPEKMRELKKRWFQSHPENCRAACARRRAKRRNATIEKVSIAQWLGIVKAYLGRCAYCGCDGKMTMDHVVALASGGAHALANLRPACFGCNFSKHTRTWVPRPWAAAIHETH